MCRSEPQIPHAATLTRISLGPGLGMGTSIISTPWSALVLAIAFISPLPPWLLIRPAGAPGQKPAKGRAVKPSCRLEAMARNCVDAGDKPVLRDRDSNVL